MNIALHPINCDRLQLKKKFDEVKAGLRRRIELNEEAMLEYEAAIKSFNTEVFLHCGMNDQSPT